MRSKGLDQKVVKGIHSPAIRRAIMLLTPVLPGSVKFPILRYLLGWSIGSDVRVGLSYLDAETLELSDGVNIGHFNVIRNLTYLRIGEGSSMHNFNRFFGGAHLAKEGYPFPSRVTIGAHVAIMSHHLADCAGTLDIDDGVTVAGSSTEIYTHQLSIRKDSSVNFGPTEVIIGSNAYVGARCTLVACVIPPEAMVGAGAVVVRDHTKDGARARVLLAGNPAMVRKVYYTYPTE